MASRPRSNSPRALALQALRELTEIDSSKEGLLGELRWLSDQNSFHATISPRDRDRACVLKMGTIIEHALRLAILSHFVDLDKNEKRDLFSADKDAPIGSFAARVRVAYALGIIGPDARDDLACIRHIRNIFAHSVEHIDFLTPEVDAVLKLLKLPSKSAWGGKSMATRQHRKRFIESCAVLVSYLVGEGAGQKPRRYRGGKFAKVMC